MLLSIIAISFAQDPAETVEDAPQYASETHIEFGYTRVGGQLVGPDGVMLSEPRGMEFTPMIELRSNFDREMAASVDLVK